MEYSDSRLMFFKSKEINMEENSTGSTKFAGPGDAAANSSTTSTSAAGGGEEAGDQAEKGNMRREHMFDKVVTPSDVGKLNRLVIPKQHAEKYFPLDTSSNEKGLLLNFEDSTGKPWRFRYSYWNSSQSYVMTKGWSRFVKEKKLDAGDIVSFERGITMAGEACLYIAWKRRPDAPPDRMLASRLFWPPPPGRPLQMPAPPPPHPSYYDYYSYGALSYIEAAAPPPSSPSVFYLRAVGAGSQQPPLGNSSLIAAGRALPSTATTSTAMTTVFDSVPIIQGKAAAKRVRLFGVNLDFPTPMEEDGPAIADEDDEDGDEAEGISRSSMALMGGGRGSSSSSPRFSSSNSTIPNWLSQATAPSHLQLSLDGGASASSWPPPPPPYRSSELPKKGKPPSLSLDL